MSEGDLSSGKSKAAQYLLQLLAPTPFTPQLSASCLGQCAISFAPKQQLSANIGNENLNVFNYDNTICQIFYCVHMLTHWLNVVWTF